MGIDAVEGAGMEWGIGSLVRMLVAEVEEEAQKQRLHCTEHLRQQEEPGRLISPKLAEEEQHSTPGHLFFRVRVKKSGSFE